VGRGREREEKRRCEEVGMTFLPMDLPDSRRGGKREGKRTARPISKGRKRAEEGTKRGRRFKVQLMMGKLEIQGSQRRCAREGKGKKKDGICPGCCLNSDTRKKGKRPQGGAIKRAGKKKREKKEMPLFLPAAKSWRRRRKKKEKKG